MSTPTTPNRILRSWREAHGLTRLQMATALNATRFAQLDQLTCDPKLIAKWESGQIRCPGPRYQRALHDLTGHYAAALGFTATSGEPSARPQRSASTPGSLPTDADLNSIGDLSDLAAELSARGYVTAVGTEPPRLTLGDPATTRQQHIITIGPCFCLDEIPFSLRPPMPLALTADAIDALKRIAITRRHKSR